MSPCFWIQHSSNNALLLLIILTSHRSSGLTREWGWESGGTVMNQCSYLAGGGGGTSLLTEVTSVVLATTGFSFFMLS